MKKRLTKRQTISKLEDDIRKLKKLIGGCEGCSECRESHIIIKEKQLLINKLKEEDYAGRK